MRLFLPGLPLLLSATLYGQPAADPFLHARYDQLHASPEQDKYRALAPMPAGVVYVQWPGEGEAQIRHHFRTMRSLGFTALKEILPADGWTIEQIQLLALDEGLIPWWYGQGGWAPVTGALRRQLGIPAGMAMAEVRRHPRMVAYQTQRLRARVERAVAYTRDHPGRPLPASTGRAFDPTVGGRGLDLSDSGQALFVAWARAQYGTIDRLNLAYNTHHAELLPEGGAYRDWDDFAARWQHYNHRSYRIRRDVMRFKADHGLVSLRQKADAYRALFPQAPFRAGGELGLFLPQAWYGVDLEGIADQLREVGSFYPSIHYAWHFDQTDNEVVRPAYMQASFANDLFKGGWSGAWECTGGPQQFDGEQDGPEKGFFVDEGTLTQFFLSQIAAGFKGFGIWCWSARSAGKEAGEYSLLDRNNQLTPRARRVGQIGQAMERYRDELWAAHKEPLVGVLVSWDNEALWAAMSAAGREELRRRPVEARIGVSRALIDGNVPYEYVTVHDLQQGLGGRYRVLYLPAVLALDPALLPLLTSYVRAGGRLVVDMPSLWYDDFARLLPTGVGSDFERLFGVALNDFQYAGQNRPLLLQGRPLRGTVATLAPTTARVADTFDHGPPAVTEHALGQGTAVLVGYAASGLCFSGNPSDQPALLRRYALGPLAAPYRCEGAIAYRLASPAADHYFLINDGPATEARLHPDGYRYQRLTDALTGEVLPAGAPVALPAYDGRWLRFEK